MEFPSPLFAGLFCRWTWRKSLPESGASGLHQLSPESERVVATSWVNDVVRNHPSGDKLGLTTPSGANMLLGWDSIDVRQTERRHTMQIKNNEYLGHKIGINGRSLRQQKISHTLILTTGGTSARVASTSQITPFERKTYQWIEIITASEYHHHTCLQRIWIISNFQLPSLALRRRSKPTNIMRSKAISIMGKAMTLSSVLPVFTGTQLSWRGSHEAWSYGWDKHWKIKIMGIEYKVESSPAPRLWPNHVSERLVPDG